MTDRESKRAGLVAGFVLIAFGCLFLLDRVMVLDFGGLHTAWPMIIVVVGVAKLFDRQTFWSGLWTIAIGAWLQLVTLHVFGLTYRNSWPLLLIVLGAGMVLRSLAEAFGRREEKHGQ